MTSAATELQTALFAALNAELPDIAVYDHAPADAAFPYMTFGRTSVFDWSTASESGAEQFVTIHVWSRARGKAQALDTIERVRLALHDRSLTLDAHRLVSLRAQFCEVRHDEDVDLYHGTIRFRAVTEPGG